MAMVCPRTGKTGHLTRQAATRHLWTIRQQRNRSYEGMAYCCRYCGYWHVGRLVMGKRR